MKYTALLAGAAQKHHVGQAVPEAHFAECVGQVDLCGAAGRFSGRPLRKGPVFSFQQRP